MSRIDVVKAEKNGTFKVLVNFCQRGSIYTSTITANSEAKKIKAKMPHADLTLFESESE